MKGLELVLIGEHVEERALRVLCAQLLGAGNRLQLPVSADDRLGVDLEVKVGAVRLDHARQGGIDVEHGLRIGNAPVALKLARGRLDPQPRVSPGKDTGIRP
jgi:hypothetical protein